MWFGQFLCEKNVLTSEKLLEAVGGYFTSREPIGKLALQSGMLSIRDINAILSEQAENPAPFGQVAIQLGILQKEQVENLVGRQFYPVSIWDYVVDEGYLSRETFDKWMIEYRRGHTMDPK